MPEMTYALLVEKAIDVQITATSPSIYTQKLLVGSPKFRLVPHCIYYYHLKFVSAGLLSMVWYFKDNGAPIPYNDLKDFITPLAQNAHAGGDDPKPVGRGLDHMEWKRKSYIVFLMDDEAWEFMKKSDQNVAIACSTEHGNTENNSFFDADDIKIDVSKDGSTEWRSAVVLLNHLKKNADGDDLLFKPDGTNDSQPFKFDMYFHLTDDTGDTRPVRLDPDGTNMGPPIGPPP
jgi:hypothetical protein